MVKKTLILIQKKGKIQLIVLKKMNHSVFGKTMENLRNKIGVNLVNNAKSYVKCISKASSVSQKIFRKKFCCYS